MKHQEVRVNIWQMIVTSGSYLFLALCAWVLLRLVNACFWLPGALKKQQAEEEAKLLEEYNLAQTKEDGYEKEQLENMPVEEEEEEATKNDIHHDQQDDMEGDDRGPPETKKTI